MKLDPFDHLEGLLAPLAQKLAHPAPGDWLSEHDEPGQTFAAYRVSHPARKTAQRHTIYLSSLGDLTPERRRILDTTAAYLEVFFDSPVRRHRQIAVEEVPAEYRRKHPIFPHPQLHSTFILEGILMRDRPEDALATLAVTADDLWSGDGWNFVFGEAYYGHGAVWSMARFGDPVANGNVRRLCLSRSLGTAAHETGHVLGMDHCIEHECSMNGCNHLEESDRKPLHLCPPCLRKLCWNLQVDLIPYLGRLERFVNGHGFPDEAAWYRRAVALLDGKGGR